MKLQKMSEPNDPTTSLFWYYDNEALSKTPSIQDGITFKTECRYRKEGARLIIDIGGKMELGYNTLATGVVFFHRFYMFHSFKTFPRYVTACSCLFLAGKVEETPKKCKDIVKAAQELLSEKKFQCFGDDPKEEVMTLEKIILQTIKFDLKVKHPYSYLTRYAKSLKGNSNKLLRMVQMAWIFINDSLCTTLPIQWEPEIIAIAVMYLAGKLCKFTVQTWHSRKPEHQYWWDLFVEDLKIEVLEDICHQVLDLYSPFQNDKTPQNNSVPVTYTPPLKKTKQIALQTTLQPKSETSLQSPSLTPPSSSRSKLQLTFDSITPSPLQSVTRCVSQTISQSTATPFIPQSTPHLISPAMSQPALQPVSQGLCQSVFEPTDSQLPLPTPNINFMLSPRDPRLDESVSALASNRLLMNSSLNMTPSKASTPWEPTTSSSSILSHTNTFNSPICSSIPIPYANPIRTLGESISDHDFRSPFNNGDGDQCCCSKNKIGDKLLMNGVGRLNDDSGNQLMGYQGGFDSSHKDDRNLFNNSQYFKSQNNSDRNSWKIKKGFGNFNNNDDGNQTTYRKGFGNSYNNDGNSSMNNQGFGNLNNNTDGSRPMYRKGFGDSYSNDGNSSMKSRGFGNLNNNDDFNRPTYKRGFGKSYDNNGNSAMKSQGFGKPWANNKRFGNNDDNRFTHRKGFGNFNDDNGNTFSGRNYNNNDTNGNDTNSWSKNKGFGNSNDNGFGFKHRKGFGDFNSSDDFQQSDTKRFRRFNDSKFTPSRGLNNSDDYVPKSSKGFENTNNGSNWSRSQTRGRGAKRFFPYSGDRNDESSWGKGPKSFNNNDKPIEEESWDESPKQSNNKDKSDNEPELDKNVEHSNNNNNNNNELNRKFPWNKSPSPQPNSLDVDKSNEESWD